MSTNAALEFQVDVPVFDILACTTVKSLLSRVLTQLKDAPLSGTRSYSPEPRRVRDHLAFRPISHSQQRMWFLHHYLDDKTVNNLLLECRVVGKIDVPTFARAWSLFTRRHESLCSRIVDTPHGLQQLPLEDPTFPLIVTETSAKDYNQHSDTARNAARNHVFDIGAGELVRGWLVISPTGEGNFFLASHHIAWDRASVHTVFKETSMIYKSIGDHQEPMQFLDPDPYQMIDYALWQNRWFEQKHLVEPQMQYWRRQLANIPSSVSLLPLSLVGERPKSKSYRVSDVERILDRDTAVSIGQFTQDRAITPFMLMASTLTLLIWQLTGDEDITIGIPDGDRGHSAFDSMVGFTVNMLAIRTKLESNDTRYCDFVENYRKTCLDAYHHGMLPYDVLLRDLNIPRSKNCNQVFQVVVNYQVAGAFKDCDYGHFKLTDYIHYNSGSQTDFKLDFEETLSGGLRCLWTYDTSLYDFEGMSEVASNFESLLKDILCKESQTRICDLLASNAQRRVPQLTTRKLLGEFEQKPFSTLFQAAISTHSDKVAICGCSGSITYRQLDLYTSQIANHLRADRLKTDAKVGICCPASVDMAIGIYGILRAGLVYVPIDIDFPEERVQQIIDDAAIEMLLIGGRGHRELIEPSDTKFLSYPIKHIEDLMSDSDNDIPIVQDSDIVSAEGFCCIFTSGTTGRPKGIMVGHRQLRYQMQSYHDYIGTCDSDKMLLVSSAVFDMSLTSLYGTILRGASLFIASQELRYSPPQLIQFAIENEITHITLTTTQLKFLFTADLSQLSQWKSLKSLVVGGEEVPTWVVSKFYSLGLPHAVLYNGYGPTETTVCNALKRILPQDQHEPRLEVGQPLFPAQFHILDENLNAVPPGTVGELYIGGEILNDGYLNREELTRASFIEKAMDGSKIADVPPIRLYKTGDKALVNASGNYQVLGRIAGDRQAKVRGIRVELNEVENAIYAALKILDDQVKIGVGLIAVVYHESQNILLAYLVADDCLIQDADRGKKLFADLRSVLKSKLPPHMIPNQWATTAGLPQTASGKLDYKSIQALSPENSANRVHVDQLAKPKDEEDVALMMMRIWRNVLDIDSELSLDDDFFALGGHSLLLLRVQREIIDTFGVQIRILDLFTNSSLHSLIALVTTMVSRNLLISVTSITGVDENRPPPKLGTEVIKNQVDSPVIDWTYETSIRLAKPLVNSRPNLSTRKVPLSNAVAILGACTMAGSHLLSHILTSTKAHVHCIAIPCQNKSTTQPGLRIKESLAHWGLLDSVGASNFERVSAYAGSLSERTLGLSQEKIALIKAEVSAIFVMDSEVSLMKRYEDLRTSNVQSLRFIISIAFDGLESSIPVHYLSTWGVPHLQCWKDTISESTDLVRHEVEMEHMEPSPDSSLGYLKARWVCEKLLCHAATMGLPVTIYRSCMCSSSRGSQRPLDREDINRRILEGILQTGLIPDFGSKRGGGMSWISADFLVESIFYLSHDTQRLSDQAQIYHIVSETHIPYTRLGDILETSRQGTPLAVVEPSEWFEALRAQGNPEITMHAEVLEAWVDAGWIPFQLNAQSTLARLQAVAIMPPTIDKEFLMRHVIGNAGF